MTGQMQLKNKISFILLKNELPGMMGLALPL